MTLKTVTLQKTLVSILLKKKEKKTFSLTLENHPETTMSPALGLPGHTRSLAKGNLHQHADV